MRAHLWQDAKVMRANMSGYVTKSLLSLIGKKIELQSDGRARSLHVCPDSFGGI